MISEIFIAPKAEQVPPFRVQCPIAPENGSVALSAWVKDQYPGHFYVRVA